MKILFTVIIFLSFKITGLTQSLIKEIELKGGLKTVYHQFADGEFLALKYKSVTKKQITHFKSDGTLRYQANVSSKVFNYLNSEDYLSVPNSNRKFIINYFQFNKGKDFLCEILDSELKMVSDSEKAQGTGHELRMVYCDENNIYMLVQNINGNVKSYSVYRYDLEMNQTFVLNENFCKVSFTDKVGIVGVFNDQLILSKTSLFSSSIENTAYFLSTNGELTEKVFKVDIDDQYVFSSQYEVGFNPYRRSYLRSYIMPSLETNSGVSNAEIVNGKLTFFGFTGEENHKLSKSIYKINTAFVSSYDLVNETEYTSKTSLSHESLEWVIHSSTSSDGTPTMEQLVLNATFFDNKIMIFRGQLKSAGFKKKFLSLTNDLSVGNFDTYKVVEDDLSTGAIDWSTSDEYIIKIVTEFIGLELKPQDYRHLYVKYCGYTKTFLDVKKSGIKLYGFD